MSRFATVGDTIPDHGEIAEIKDVGHESYFMLYTFTNGRTAMLQGVRIEGGKASYREHDGFGVD